MASSDTGDHVGTLWHTHYYHHPPGDRARAGLHARDQKCHNIFKFCEALFGGDSDPRWIVVAYQRSSLGGWLWAWLCVKNNKKSERFEKYTLEWFSEAESARIRSASKFCVDLYVRKNFQLFLKIFFWSIQRWGHDFFRQNLKSQGISLRFPSVEFHRFDPPQQVWPPPT